MLRLKRASRHRTEKKKTHLLRPSLDHLLANLREPSATRASASTAPGHTPTPSPTASMPIFPTLRKT